MNSTIKTFVNLNREENPDFKEEEIEEEDRNTKLAELEKIKALNDHFTAEKDTNCYEIVELNADLPFRTVLGYIDKLYQVDLILIRNFTTDNMQLQPLLFK